MVNVTTTATPSVSDRVAKAQLAAQERIAKITARLEAARATAANAGAKTPKAPKTKDPREIAATLSATLAKAIKSVENSKRLLGWILKENVLNWAGMTADNGPWLDAVRDEYVALKAAADAVLAAPVVTVVGAPAPTVATVVESTPAPVEPEAAPVEPEAAPAVEPEPEVKPAKRNGKK